MIRGRPVGSVIVDLCRDLGITTTHPLWPEVRDAIMFHGGSLVDLLEVWRECSITVFASNYPEDLLPNPSPVWGDWPDMTAGFVFTEVPTGRSTGPP